ncbi:MAG: OmpA family protein [Polyangiaceae bacterium]|nr:OmpA family protein [Polyangiaceae bacterium]
MALSTLASGVVAQTGDPAPTDPAEPPAAEAPAAPPAEAAPPPGASAGGSAEWSFSGFGGEASAESSGAAAGPATPTDPVVWRRESLKISNSLSGSTGLLRVAEAGSGAPGTFRLQFLTGFYSGSDFLCGSGGERTCPTPSGASAPGADEVSRLGVNLSLSATILPFFEAYLALTSYATSNDQGRPELLQVMGDTNLGLKFFTPHEDDQLFSFGGEAQLFLLNGTGGVGLDGGSTSFALRGLATLDLHNRTAEEERIPLRAHVNLGYYFDNSGEIVADTESRRGRPISRIERFGLEVNRTDALQIGLGVEGVFDIFRPFLEYTVDVPVNRQGYTCNRSLVVGEQCLEDGSGFSTTPQRLTLGARVHPWLDGLGFTAAFDIGTGATSSFLEEVAPELPWALWLGVGYAYDVNEVEPTVKVVEIEKPAAASGPQRYVIAGAVVDESTKHPIPGAILTFEGRPLTGMVARADGSFISADLDPGTYTMRVSAEGYRAAECSATLVVVTPTPAPGQAAPSAPTGPSITQVTCELSALPKVGNVVGQLQDSEGGTVTGATVKITDPLGRELELSADASGAFRFENVVPGTAKITVTAPDYFVSVTEWDVQAQQDVQARISLNKRPKTANVVATAKELQLRKQVHFEHNSSTISPDSMALLQEIAEVLRAKPEITSLEIQGHTDNTGSAEYNMRLSNERAAAVRDALIKMGINGSRLTAKGYGQTKPLVPNVSDANRTRNRRVQLMIQ